MTAALFVEAHVTTPRVILVIAIGLVGALVCAWQVRRILREPQHNDRTIHTDPPIVETEPGIDLSLHDECELIWSIPERAQPDLSAGLDLLRQAMRDQQQGEATDA